MNINRNTELVNVLVSLFSEYGYMQDGFIKMEQDYGEPAYVSLDNQGEYPPITIAVVRDENGDRALIRKAAVEIYPADRLQLMEAINLINNSYALGKCTIEKDDDADYLAVSQAHMLHDVPGGLILHQGVMDELKMWKSTIGALIDDGPIRTNPENVNIYCG